jgi:hypothetical protein
VYIGKPSTGARKRQQLHFGIRLYAKAFLNEYKLRLFCAYEKIMMKEQEGLGRVSEIIGKRVQRLSVNIQPKGNHNNSLIKSLQNVI